MSKSIANDTYFSHLSVSPPDKFTKYYLRTKWLGSIDLETDIEKKPVCDLSVTDCRSFWQREVGDLRRGKPSGITETSQFLEATHAVLSGKEFFNEFRLSCQVTSGTSTVTLKWSWRVEDPGEDPMLALPMTLGSIGLILVSENECFKLWPEWLDFLLEDRTQYQLRCEALEMRVTDLEKIHDLTEQKMNKMAEDKLTSETILLENFRDLLNSKKKKIKSLLKLLEKSGVVQRQAESDDNQSVASGLSFEMMDENTSEAESIHEQPQKEEEEEMQKQEVQHNEPESNIKKESQEIEIPSPPAKMKNDQVADIAEDSNDDLDDLFPTKHIRRKRR
ncbi:7793_t:CDS:2 [Ambispora gerdemannii]|uniref:7793_t:CDS:1 n=1 Tax=Ambispora gerdemannii TaxID=144530 RepID=A0A9N8UVE3_9GLOM|nr:7793_t:CDS:2 [Ambispora gerdemannii]